MGLLFGKKQKGGNVKHTSVEHRDVPHATGVTFSFIQSHNFRGYKRIRLSTYGYKEIEHGIQNLEKENPKFDLANKNIELKEIVFDAFTDNDYNRCIQVFVENNHVGTLFYDNNDDYYNKIIGGMVEKVFVMINSDESRYTSYLFCKFSE